MGSGGYSGRAPTVNETISATVKWSDGTHTFTQNINAIVDSVTKTGHHEKEDRKTFTWHITESNFSTTFPNLNLGSDDTVQVTFPQTINPNGTTYGTVSSPITTFAYGCFLCGTRILTRYGYCPVEELVVGDEVRTMNSDWQPLRWIGHQRVVTLFGLVNGTPVRITTGAFGPALPERDVCVSQDHAIFFRNELIPVKSLINGVTVFRDTSVKDIKYFHLLRDRHAVIFSEGLATESYMPCENIEWFDNTSECLEALLNAICAGTAECLIENAIRAEPTALPWKRLAPCWPALCQQNSKTAR
ncbi:Hint domain-containing protein [Nitrosomonas sp. Is37]|uniref:Hint domain-containing protein n=1 Tax=Nitrosomonas sp. Is37 TaxID=3080535 RepID=UPI00294B8C03|nr:Hint domain-containing protein [Nitrosomonas sp. Is37]MDV6344202.1 Hint domain-containing protein [Nitrosomonas sp. Is37]